MADNAALIAALQGFTTAVATDATARQNQMTQLLQVIGGQQQNQAAMQAVVAAPPNAPVIHPSTVAVNSLPHFSGGADEDAQWFVDQVNRVAGLEGWTDDNCLLVAVTRLRGTASQWHAQAGQNDGTWPLWSAALVTNFSYTLSFLEWSLMMEARVQKPGESCLEYALDKRRLCLRSPVPLPEADIIKALLRGLANPIYIAALTAQLPATFADFLTRLRDLEQLGLSSMGPQAPTSTLPAAQSLPPVNTTFHNAPPPTVVPDIEKLFVNFGDKLINQLSASISRLQVGPATNVAPRGVGTHGPRGQEARNCYVSLPLIKVWLENIGEVIALVDSGASVKSRILMGKLKGVDNKVVKIEGTVPVNVKWKGKLVELNTVTVLRTAPFAFILGTDWIVKSKASLIVKDNRIEIIGEEETIEGKQETFDEHLARLDMVLKALERANLTLNVDKCIFGASVVSHLGHVINAEGIHPESEKVRALTEMPVKNLKSLRAFLGLASFYRRFIPDFATIAQPLHSLLKKNAVWNWTDKQEAAKKEIISRMTSAPVLAHFDDALKVTVQTDASQIGLGAVLSQDSGNGQRPVAFISRKLTDTETRYHANELECLAVVWALKKLRSYIYGRHFTIKTDSSAVKWMVSKKEVKEHVKGVENQMADALSRNPDESRSGTSDSGTKDALVAVMVPQKPVATHELALLQQQDGKLRPIFTSLQSVAPSKIITDQGTCFTSELFDEWIRKWGIQHIQATAEHPETNGLVERVNRTSTLALCAFINAQHNDWDKHLAAAAYAINTARQSTTEITPFELVNGRQPVLPVERLFPWPAEEQESHVDFLSRVHKLREAARLRILKKQRAVKDRVDKRRRVEFELLPGDLVLVRRRPLVKKVSATTFLVEDLPAVRKKNSFRRFHAHVCQIRRFNGRVDDEWDEDEQGIEDRIDELDDDEEQLREIANVHERENEEEGRREHERENEEEKRREQEREKEERTTTTRTGRKTRRPVWMKDFTEH
ncbi:hypothetical protein GHT06_015104 [Daphnia sinensis]|uniref:Integrase catalytic domain-containing protein n=1 Tax=Daphnia sinensis TaxID=1820382 RepID=A0AAD5KQT3_9CRUS|nr:hypothetical protein GHT06_015104 [Daphnia sinensis]